MERNFDYEGLSRPNEEKIVLTWNNIRVDARPPATRHFFSAIRQRIAGKKAPPNEIVTILKGVSGYAESGNMIAIMGPSGAGKTTLLATLAKRTEASCGSVEVNGCSVSRATIAKISGYMDQFDKMPPLLTSKEHLLFTCTLKVERGSNSEERRFHVQELLTEFGLVEHGDTLISRLSAGEKKRLALASELITKPKILFLDEPTTGLDRYCAMRVIEILKLMSLRNRLIFCTIHQPGMAAFSAFSRVTFMCNGRIVYFGSVENATKFFDSQGYRCPASFDRSDYYVSLLSPQGPESSERMSKTLSNAFLRSPFYEEHAVISNRRENLTESDSNNGSRWITQLYWITWRILKQKRRTIFVNRLPWIAFLTSMFLICAFYYKSDSRTQEGAQNVRGALYMITSEIIFTVAYSVLFELPGDYVIYMHERSLYGPAVYYIANFIGLMPITVLKAIIFTFSIYFISKESIGVLSFLLYCLCTTTGALCGTAYGMMVSSWIERIDIAMMIMTLTDLCFILSAGIFYNLRSLPVYLAYLKYLSVFYYMNEALAILYWSEIDSIECYANEEFPCLASGSEILSEYGFTKTNFICDLNGIILLTTLMSLFGYMGIRSRKLTIKNI